MITTASAEGTAGGPRHLAISGDLGSGKSSVAEQVAKRLGFRLVSTGAIQREIARELQLSTLETNLLAEKDRQIDRRVDSVTQALGRDSKESIVFDSRMAWYMISNAFRVRLIVDPQQAVDRILGRGSSDVEAYAHREHAEDEIRRRYESEVRRFLARYGVDVTALKHFDLVVDTSDVTVEQVADIIATCYLGSRPPGVYVSPKRVLPSQQLCHDPKNDPKPSVIYARPFMVGYSGLGALQQSLSEDAGLTSVNVVAEGFEGVSDGANAIDFPVKYTSEELLDGWEKKYGLDFSGYRRWVNQANES